MVTISSSRAGSETTGSWGVILKSKCQAWQPQEGRMVRLDVEAEAGFCKILHVV